MCSKILPFFTSGIVCKGFGRGSAALGVPTANLPEDTVEKLPKELETGVYYGWASLEGAIYKMVASIGWNPFYKNKNKSMEVHILYKFSENFYGKNLKVIVAGFIRPEKNFPSVEALIEEINNDIAIAKEKLDETSMLELKNNTFLS
ncbi:riboflavin kinase [Prorops nasuta]|uniref:riboflavin kinase n=1 Tax=Prorops nasuta TaxID=863751 RepID=UPI0034CFFA52